MQNNEEDNKTGVNQAGRRANSPVKLLTASSICGDKIYNPSGEQLGKIKDIMLNLSDGTIQYVVIEYGGFIGIGKKYFSVPFGKLIIDAAREAFVINETKDSFENNPGFDKDHWPQSNAHVEQSKNYGGFMGPNTGSDH